MMTALRGAFIRPMPFNKSPGQLCYSDIQDSSLSCNPVPVLLLQYGAAGDAEAVFILYALQSRGRHAGKFLKPARSESITIFRKERMLNLSFIRQVGPVQWAVRYSMLQFRKRILRQDSTLRLPTGMRIRLPRHSGCATEVYVTNGNIDWGSEAVFVQFAEPSRDFLDIGSHFGYYATYCAPRVRQVYAFEPGACNLTALRQNAALSSNIQIVEMAVSSHDGEADFFSGVGSTVGSLNNVGGAVTKVRITTVDSFVENHPEINVGLIKTDIEGHDLEALQGMHATVARFQPLILTECEWSQALQNLCAAWKYRIFAFTHDRLTDKPGYHDLSDDDVTKYFCKMLFLVPEKLQPAFSGIGKN
ncbi:FkbM family methyltransferase [Paracidobacterium acidisoli]|uniref:FkbM family methyltransferase n=1 Tax=Paracidobacterium acidisoli TaxID=2303751 RepID=A0A372IM36_9BACT|nr:FkbM family methyltransferase [Paracidobacterium acidisoli]MBT9331633.1 FkbM family methyltransferase [Paracidobacterium acidisoli]